MEQKSRNTPILLLSLAGCARSMSRSASASSLRLCPCGSGWSTCSHTCETHTSRCMPMPCTVSGQQLGCVSLLYEPVGINEGDGTGTHRRLDLRAAVAAPHPDGPLGEWLHLVGLRRQVRLWPLSVLARVHHGLDFREDAILKRSEGRLWRWCSRLRAAEVRGAQRACAVHRARRGRWRRPPACALADTRPSPLPPPSPPPAPALSLDERGPQTTPSSPPPPRSPLRT
eukprot:scaffold296833_cov30-Tisochrysis_lutea.AAC.3